MERFIKFTIIIFIVLVGILLIFYPYSTKINKSIQVCSLDGELKEIELNLIWQKNSFRGSELHGSVVFDGKEYRSVYGSYNNGIFKRYLEYPNFLDGLYDKINGVGYYKYVIFESSDYIEGNTDEYNYLSVIFANTDFAEICIWVKSDNIESESIAFYGPAETGAEAFDIMNLIDSRLKDSEE